MLPIISQQSDLPLRENKFGLAGAFGQKHTVVKAKMPKNRRVETENSINFIDLGLFVRQMVLEAPLIINLKFVLPKGTFKWQKSGSETVGSCSFAPLVRNALI